MQHVTFKPESDERLQTFYVLGRSYETTNTGLSLSIVNDSTHKREKVKTSFPSN